MKYFIFFFLAMLASCSVTRKNKEWNLHGEYWGTNSQESLYLEKDSTFVLLAYSDFTDTLSYGKWNVADNFIDVNSDEKLFNIWYDIDVEESISGSKDSIYISVENKLSGLIDIDDVFTPYIYFNADFYFKDNSFQETEQFVNETSITKRSLVSKFNINIIPNLITYPEKTCGTVFKTMPYICESTENNTYKVTIQEFDKKHFSYRPLKGDYIKLAGKDTLVWNGELFVKYKDY